MNLPQSLLMMIMYEYRTRDENNKWKSVVPCGGSTFVQHASKVARSSSSYWLPQLYLFHFCILPHRSTSCIKSKYITRCINTRKPMRYVWNALKVVYKLVQWSWLNPVYRAGQSTGWGRQLDPKPCLQLLYSKTQENIGWDCLCTHGGQQYTYIHTGCSSSVTLLR